MGHPLLTLSTSTPVLLLMPVFQRQECRGKNSETCPPPLTLCSPSLLRPRKKYTHTLTISVYLL